MTRQTWRSLRRSRRAATLPDVLARRIADQDAEHDALLAAWADGLPAGMWDLFADDEKER